MKSGQTNFGRTFKMVTPLEKRRRAPNRNRRHARQSNIDSSAIECVPPVPVPDGDYLDQLLQLKEQAFTQVQMIQNSPSQPGKLCRRPQFPKPITSYQAFTEYNSSEFYNAPFEAVTSSLAQAWQNCPNKDVWEYYAYAFNKADTDLTFQKWLDMCPKKQMLLIVQEPCENYQ